jgi:hypothetical protein
MGIQKTFEAIQAEHYALFSLSAADSENTSQPSPQGFE